MHWFYYSIKCLYKIVTGLTVLKHFGLQMVGKT